MNKKNWPIIVGIAQFTQDKNSTQPLDPLNLIVKACQTAIINTGIDNLQEYIDTLYLSTISSWIYKDFISKISDILTLKLKQRFIAPISGNVPQMLVNKAAKAIALGRSKIVLIAGGEAEYSKYRYRKGKITLDWPKQPPRTVDQAQKAINYYFSAFEI
ncbi:MAG: hypothetical protein ACFE9T_02570, partial [Promethearchaeota archaeon]